MAELYRFFDNVEGDRTYNADEFAEYFRQVLTTGILNGGENLQVYCNGNDNIARIKPGKAWIEGYFYKNTDEIQEQLEPADGTYDRIDRIVLRLDKNPENRYIKVFVKTGTPAATPVPPDLQRDDMIYEISLAQIYITHNTTIIPVDKVTDERLNTDVCGLVNSLIQVDAYHMTQQFEDWYNTHTTQWQNDWNTWFQGLQSQSILLRASGIANFNGPTGTTIQCSKGDTNYIVIITPISDAGGYLGEVWVEKAATSFTVKCSGSATTSFEYAVFW